MHKTQTLKLVYIRCATSCFDRVQMLKWNHNDENDQLNLTILQKRLQ